ncbi:unnamed protein product [Larinioides sclopetarius]|uniref:Uncharacterized protein n=1 Tax=Larinioides sclopetarius TaxID=280406 RepID=A0AAV1ZCZ0_9ARAC
MTRFLKLVRHEDGKWKALPTETDGLAQVSLKERLYAPIDPDQLLKALDSLLSKNGGIKSIEDVPRLARYVFICHGNKFISCHGVL